MTMDDAYIYTYKYYHILDIWYMVYIHMSRIVYPSETTVDVDKDIS